MVSSFRPLLWVLFASASAANDPTHDPVPEELVQAAVRGEVVAIVGAGVSMSAGLPGFWPLLEAVARGGGRSDLIDQQWEDVDHFQFALAEALGKPRMCELLGQGLAAPDPLPEAYLQNAGNLTRLPLCSVVSFNWDALLPPMYTPAAWRDAGFSSLCAARHHMAPLFEVQGSVNDCDNIVISESDYAAVSEDRTSFFARLLSEATVLYVGMNVRSGYVLMQGTGPWPKRHYAIVNDVTADERVALDAKGLTAISFDARATHYRGMTDVLDELASRVEDAVGPPVGSSPPRFVL
jgi:hypothetical protein